MSRLLTFGVILSALVLVACGGGGGNTITNPGGGGGGSGGVNATQVQLLASSPQLQSDVTGANSITLTAIVKDENNVVASGATVVLSSNSGDIGNPNPTTDANGIVTGALTTRDPMNRSISVTATVTDTNGNTATDTVSINVVGTTLEVTGPNALAQGQTGTYSVVLADSNGVGISGKTASITSSSGNTLSAASLTTGAGGETQFMLTGDNAGADIVATTALGITTNVTVTVSDDVFNVTTPTAGAEIPIGTVVNVTAVWNKAGVPQGGETINFSSTRGTLSSASAVTDPGGEATVTINSTSAGPAVISATNPEFTSSSVSVEFVATVADDISIQASPFTVPVNQVSQITAVVRDPTDNLVKNKTVVFELTDVTGGFLSVASAVTDSQGRARTTYTAGGTTSAQDAVKIRAFVQDTPAVEDTVSLTVAAEELFLSLGTGNDINEITQASFSIEWDIYVTDVDGNPVPDKPVQVSILSTHYRKGFLTINAGGDQWVQDPANYVECQDEDTLLANEADRNGILDPGEDFNGSGKIEAGNIAAVTPAPNDSPDACGEVAGGSGTEVIVTTSDIGLARVCVVYPQDHGLWVRADIEAEASVSGTEFSSKTNFLLPALSDDLNDTDASPPGQTSPFGPDLDCSVPPP